MMPHEKRRMAVTVKNLGGTGFAIRVRAPRKGKEATRSIRRFFSIGKSSLILEFSAKNFNLKRFAFEPEADTGYYPAFFPTLFSASFPDVLPALPSAALRARPGIIPGPRAAGAARHSGGLYVWAPPTGRGWVENVRRREHGKPASQFEEECRGKENCRKRIP